MEARDDFDEIAVVDAGGDGDAPIAALRERLEHKRLPFVAHDGGGRDGHRLPHAPLREIDPHKHPRLQMGVVVVELGDQRHAPRFGLDDRPDMVHAGHQFVALGSRNADLDLLPMDDVNGRPLALVDLGPHPQQRGVGDDEHRTPPLDPFPPGHEDILDNPIKRRPHHEGA